MKMQLKNGLYNVSGEE